jgi:hypothetical protein
MNTIRNWFLLLVSILMAANPVYTLVQAQNSVGGGANGASTTFDCNRLRIAGKCIKTERSSSYASAGGGIIYKSSCEYELRDSWSAAGFIDWIGHQCDFRQRDFSFSACGEQFHGRQSEYAERIDYCVQDCLQFDQ